MRKLLLISFLISFMSCSDKPVLPAELPTPIRTFVKQNFPTQTIMYAEQDLDWFWYKYDVTLADGTQISFDTDNVWDKVDCHLLPVPAQLVPQIIANFVSQNYPSVPIVKIDKESYGYEVKLANQLEMKFTEQGALMGMDD